MAKIYQPLFQASLMKKLILFVLLASPAGLYAATEIITLKPVATGPVTNGDCFLTSITSQRNDAWRCSATVAGSPYLIYDPCFTADASKNLVVCGINPMTHDNGFTVKTNSFPKSKLRNLQTWLVQLSDGSYCQQIVSPLRPMIIGGLILTDQNNKPLGQESLFYTCSGTQTLHGHTVQSGLLANSIVPGVTWSATRVYYYSGHIFDSTEQVDLARVWE